MTPGRHRKTLEPVRSGPVLAAPVRRRGRWTVTATVAAIVMAMATTLVAPALSQDLSKTEWDVRLEDTARGGPVPQATAVDGRPVDPSVLGAEPLRTRRASAALGGVEVEGPGAVELRDRAQQILDRPAYGGEQQSLWRRLFFDNPVAEWFRDVWQRVVRWIAERFSLGGGDADPGDPVDPNRRSYGLALIAAVVIGAVALSWRVVQRRSRADDPEIEWFESVPTSLRTREALERAALEAEASGRYAESIRFRFLAGLRHLEELRRISLRPSMRMSEVRRQVGTVAFDEAAVLFERAVYSEHAPSAAEVAAHRRAWDVVSGFSVMS